MKKITLLSLLTIVTASYSYDNYMKSSILYTMPNNIEGTNSGLSTTLDMKSGYALEVGFGSKISRNLAVEIQYTYDKANVKSYSSNIKVHSIFFNGVYNFNNTNSSMHPYIGLGVGAASYGDGSFTDEVFAYQGFTGISFDVDYNMETFIEYKYKDFSEVNLEGITYDNTGIHSVGFGLKSKF